MQEVCPDRVLTTLSIRRSRENSCGRSGIKRACAVIQGVEQNGKGEVGTIRGHAAHDGLLKIYAGEGRREAAVISAEFGLIFGHGVQREDSCQHT